MKEFRVGFLLKLLVVENEKAINEELKKYDLTMSQVRILKYLFKNHRSKEIVQRDIEKDLESSNPTVSGLLSRMEDKGLIERKESKNDARSRSIIPTKKALLLDKIIHKSFSDSNKRLVQDFSNEEKEQLHLFIEKMQNNLNKCKE